MEEQQPLQHNDHPVRPQVSAKPKHLSHRTRQVLLAVVLFLFISISSGFVGGWIGARNRTNNSLNVSQGKQIVEQQSTLISSIAKDVSPSVVSVDVTSQGQSVQSLFGTIPGQEQQSAGTGLIISSSGYVITNRHVIPDGVTKLSLTMSDGTVLNDVSVVGKTKSTDPLDIGFLKINNAKGKTLQPAKLGDSNKMQVGNTVVAIGNALGQFQNTVTSGIISGYGRDVQASDESGSGGENLQNLFQTDAAINPGNSGGPLVNSNSEVIGINTAVAGDGAQNIGFAIPMNDIKGLLNSVLNKGVLERPYLGVQYIQLSPTAAQQLNINTEQGAYVKGTNGPAVIPGSPAEKAGLKEGDIITKINNQTVDSNNTLSSVIGQYNVGDTVTVTYVRDGKEQTTQVKLGSTPSS